MSTDRDGLLIHLAAGAMMNQYGPYAARISHERAELADGIAADAWRDIAHAIEVMETSYYQIETRPSAQRPGERGESMLRVVS
jgi:hypothetical protein